STVVRKMKPRIHADQRRSNRSAFIRANPRREVQKNRGSGSQRETAAQRERRPATASISCCGIIHNNTTILRSRPAGNRPTAPRPGKTAKILGLLPVSAIAAIVQAAQALRQLRTVVANGTFFHFVAGLADAPTIFRRSVRGRAEVQ